MHKIIRVADIAYLNKETYKKDAFPKFIKYLDTGSLTKNKIDSFQILDTTKDKVPSRAQRKAKKGTILYSTVRPNQEHYGYIEREIDDLVVSTGFTTVDVFDKNINSKYLYYLLTQKSITDYLQILGTSGVSAYPSISPSDIGDLTFKIPSKKEQNKIVKILADLDGKIELNNKINTELEAMAKLIYDYWFVQFDFPFDFAQGKPDENGKPYKSSGGKMVYNEELKREIPEGWNVGTLLDIANYQNGLACQKYRPINKKYLPVIKIREMRDGFTDKTEKVRFDVPDRVKISDGDILFSWSASLEVMIWSGGKGALNQHIFKVTSDNYPKSYFYFELLNYLHHFKMIAELRKTTMGHITQDHLKQSRIAIPPLSLTEKLEEKLAPILRAIVTNNKETQKLAELRDWLLPMLMNGQVTVGIAYEKEGEQLSVAAEPEPTYDEVKVVKFAELYPDPYVKRQRERAKHKLKRRQVLTTTRIIALHQKNGQDLGHTKTEKINHAIEYIGQVDLGRDPVKNVGGPVDFYYVKGFVEPLAKKQKVFEAIESPDGYYYETKTNFETFLNVSYQEKELARHNDKIDEIINTFVPLSLRETELYMTVYAAWNNLIIRKEAAILKNIITEALDLWKDKRDKFTDDHVEQGVKWLEEINYIPKGYGKEVF